MVVLQMLVGRGRLAGSGRIVAPGLALLVLAGCGGGAAWDARGPATGVVPLVGPGPPPGAGQSVGRDPSGEPGRVVSEFLDAANRRDHAAMSRLFGTAAGPVGERGSALGCGLRRMGSWIGLGERCVTAQEVELRMDLMAGILAHESYRVGTGSTVVGRGRPATRVDVRMDVGGGAVVAVPFVVIRADDGRWLVTEVALGRLTG